MNFFLEEKYIKRNFKIYRMEAKRSRVDDDRMGEAESSSEDEVH